MFEGFNNHEKKTIADVIMWTIHHDVISSSLMMKTFQIEKFVAQSTLEMLSKIEVIEENDQQPELYYVLINEVENLLPEVLDLLINCDYSLSDIKKAVQGVPKEEKYVSSNILSDKSRDWIPFNETKPKLNTPILIRFTDESTVLMESKTEIVYSEDLKIAMWDGIEFHIMAPYPKYDFSPLSNKEYLNDGVFVTHWSNINRKDLEGWQTRFNPINKYKHLELSVSREQEEEVYKALILAAACIMRTVNDCAANDPTRDKLVKAHSVMCDLQSAIDYGIIQNSEGE